MKSAVARWWRGSLTWHSGGGCETAMDFLKQTDTTAAVGMDTHRVLWIAGIATAADVMKKPSGARRKTSQLAYHNKCFWLNV